MTQLSEQLKRHEGFRTDPYLCSENHHTIGYGHNLDANPLPWLNPPITEEEASRILDSDIAICEQACQHHIPFFGGLDQVRQAVLLNMCFNLGVWGLMAFRKFLAAMAESKWELAAKEMLFSKWAEQVKRRAAELAAMMVTGKWEEKS